jgi:hypothetical protein
MEPSQPKTAFSSIKLLSYDAAGAHFGQPGYETDLLYIAGLLALCFGGAGPFSWMGHIETHNTNRAYVDWTALRAAPELAMTTTIRNTPRTTDCQ